MLELLTVSSKVLTAPPPGPSTLIAGDAQLGWYGEVATTNLIAGDALAITLGLTQGTGKNPTAPWLKFAYKGKTLFIAKRTYRHTISMDAFISTQTRDGSKIITVNGVKYRIRLITGTDGAGELAVGGEWNDLIYRVATGTQIAADQKWANYTLAELDIGSGTNGYITWCKEVRATAGSVYATRGNGSITAIYGYTSSAGSAPYGWRPVLEVV